MSSPPWRVGSGLVTPAHIAELRELLGLPDPVAWDNVGDKPSTFPHAPHNHSMSQVIGLAEALGQRTTKRVEMYAGTTNASGEYIVTFASPFNFVPWVIPESPNSANYFWMRIDVSTTGATYRLVQRSAVTVLTFEVLLAAVVPVSGAACRLIVVGD